MARFFIIIGIILILIGFFWPFISKLGLGNLPGDIVIKRGNFSFYFPIVTCILVSIILTIILWLINR